VKAHAGLYGNETADWFAKEATQNYYVTYSRIQKSTIRKETREESIRNLQSQWEETTKGANAKEFFFSSVERRLAVNLHLNPNVTTIMSGHGNIRSCLHRLKIIDQSRVSMQTRHTNSRPFDISVRKVKERGMLKNSVLKAGNWPISKSELINKNLKQFTCFINSMDLEKWNHSKRCKLTLITDMYNYVSI